jgi:hypothetical protein
MWHVWEIEEVHAGFWWGDLREKDHLLDVGVNERKLLKMDIQEVGLGGMDWIDLSQDTDRWRALVKAVININININNTYYQLVEQCLYLSLITVPMCFGHRSRPSSGTSQICRRL